MQKTLQKLRNGQHTTIVAFGDSITETTFHTRGRMNWVQLLKEAIFETYGTETCTMINSGRCGGTIKQGLGRIERDVLRYEPDLVIIAFGMNDCGNDHEGLPAFKEDMKTAIKMIRERCDSDILIRTPNPVITTCFQPPPEGQEKPCTPWEAPGRPLKEYAAVLVDLAGELVCPCIDHYTLWSEKDISAKLKVADPNILWSRMSDPCHPGPLGHLVFFREIAHLFNVPKYFPWEDIEK